MVRVERRGGVAVVTIDNPPVNAMSHAVRARLLDTLTALVQDPSARAVVIACAGRTFVAGADITEFDRPPQPPLLREVLDVLDGFDRPVVAAIHGTALGGGFELALACHARVAAPDAAVGLPEVRLGLIPGAGGTVRTPRVAGPLAALDMVTTGRHVRAGEALRLGLIDQISDDPLAQAIRHAETLQAGGWRRAIDRPMPDYDRSALDAAVEAARAKARGATAPVAAAEAILRACDGPIGVAFDAEQATSHELRRGPQSRALRHLFHAERRAVRPPKDATAREISQAGVVGGGTMGSGIAIALAEAGIGVTLVEVSDAAARAAEKRVRAVFDRQLRNGRLSAEAHAARLARIVFSTSLDDLSPCALVIEAIIEDLDAKRALFTQLADIVGPNAILASNTSYLDIDAMAAATTHPDRVLGLHFFSPAHVMRLLEVVRAEHTSLDTVATGIALGKRLKKLPVVCGVGDGFIGNRLLARWRLQGEYALEDGASPQQVDAAMEAFGFPMGPFAVADLSGLDIGWANRKRRAATRDPNERYVPVADWLCEQRRFGQKTGAGWYRHVDGRRDPDPEVDALIDKARKARGAVARPISDEEIQARVHAAMVNEGAKALAEGVASTPADIDLVLVNGYGYPAWRGGPMHEADAIGLQGVLRRVEAMYAADGAGWEPAALLRDLASSGEAFARLNGGTKE